MELSTPKKDTSDQGLEPLPGARTKRSVVPKFETPFGVGCFHFASLRSDIKQKSEYFSDLKDFLLSDKLVTNVEIEENDRTIALFEYNNKEIDDTIGNQNELHPYLQDCLIRVDFHIPTRIQKEYIGSWREPVSETITLELDYSENFPVAFVWVDSGTSPSTAVHILWKHFKRSNPNNKAIKFQMLGPSPFHMDFFVRGVEREAMGIVLRENAGYDDLYINISNKTLKADIRALIRYRLTDELAVFYRASSDRVEFIHRFEIIAARVSSIIDDDRIANRIRRFIIGDSSTYKLAIEIERLLIDQERTVSVHRSYLESIKKQFGEIAVEHKVEGSLVDILEMPLRGYLNIVSILRERHNNSRTNYYVVIAAVVGAAAAVAAGAFGAK